MLASGRWSEAVLNNQEQVERCPDKAARAEVLQGLAEALCRLEQDGRRSRLTEAQELFRSQDGDFGRDARGLLAGVCPVPFRECGGRRSLLAGPPDQRHPDGRAMTDLRMRVLMALGSVASSQDDHRASLAYLEEARVLAADLDDRRRASYLSARHQPCRDRRYGGRSIGVGTESLALFRSAEARREAAVIENNLALSYLQLGNLARATELATEARHRHEADADRRALAHVVETEAQIALARGDFGQAIKSATLAIDHAVASDNLRARSSALLTIARALAASERVDEALAGYGATVELLRATGPVPRLQHALAEWADLLARLGRHREAFDLTREALRAGHQGVLPVGDVARTASPASPRGAASTASPRRASEASARADIGNSARP